MKISNWMHNEILVQDLLTGKEPGVQHNDKLLRNVLKIYGGENLIISHEFEYKNYSIKARQYIKILNKH